MSFTPESREHGESIQRALAEEGVFVPFAVYPGTGRAGVLRVAVSSEHESGDLGYIHQSRL